MQREWCGHNYTGVRMEIVMVGGFAVIVVMKQQAPFHWENVMDWAQPCVYSTSNCDTFLQVNLG